MRDVNLIPYDLVQQQEGSRHLRLWLWAFSGAVLAMGVFFMIQNNIVQKTDSEVHQLETRNRALKQQYARVKDLQKKQAELTNKARVLQMLLAKRNFTQFLIGLESAMPPAVWLTHMSLDKMLAGSQEEASGEWVETGYFVVKKSGSQEKKEPDPTALLPEVVLKGFSLTHIDLVHFIRSLDQATLFLNVDLRHCKTDQRDTKKIEFEIHAYLKKETLKNEPNSKPQTS